MDDIGTILFLLLFVFGPLLKKLGEKKAQQKQSKGQPGTPSPAAPLAPSSAPTSEVDPEEELRRFLESLTGKIRTPQPIPQPTSVAPPKARQSSPPRPGAKPASLDAEVNREPRHTPKRPPKTSVRPPSGDEAQRAMPTPRPRTSTAPTRRRQEKTPKTPQRLAAQPPLQTKGLGAMSNYDSRTNLGNLALSSPTPPPSQITPQAYSQAQTDLRAALLDPTSLRRAILLNEILSPPRAMRSWDSDQEEVYTSFS